MVFPPLLPPFKRKWVAYLLSLHHPPLGIFILHPLEGAGRGSLTLDGTNGYLKVTKGLVEGFRSMCLDEETGLLIDFRPIGLDE